jgi:hypothetical protein
MAHTPTTPTPAPASAPAPADASASASASAETSTALPNQGQVPEREGAARRWTVTTVNGVSVSGYLPKWAEDDPSESGVAPERLSVTLVDIAHRRAFDGIALTAFTEGRSDRAHLVNAFAPEIQCHPCPDPELPGESLVPVVNVQISPECWMTDLGPDQLLAYADQFDSLAHRIRSEVVPTLEAARADWTAHTIPHPRAGEEAKTAE